MDTLPPTPDVWGAPPEAPPEATSQPSPRAGGRSDIRIARRFGLPPQTVFGAWVDPRLARRFLLATASRPLARVKIDARVGGSFRLVERSGSGAVEHTGEYIEIVPPRRLAFTLSMEDRRVDFTRVTVDIAALARGCRLCLVHEDVPADCTRRVAARWTGVLYGLGEILGARS